MTTPLTGSTYRYVASNILSGAVVGDWLPMTTQNAAVNINAVGTYTGSLNLGVGTPAENRNWVAALEPEKSVLWILQDAVPVWNGIVWDWPDMGRNPPPLLPISASTCESLFQHRYITDDLTFTNMDVFDIFRALAVYATSKQPNGQLAGLVMSTNESGITDTVSYAATDMKAVYDAWTDLISTYGFEYSIVPGTDINGNLSMTLELGYPELGQPLAQSGLAYSFPGNLLDYRFPRTGSTSANRVIATASSSGTLAPLNDNTDFETGILPWTGVNGAEPVQSPAWSSGGNFSMQVSGDGVTPNPGALSEIIPVTAGQAYTMTAQLFCQAGWATNQLSFRWLNAGGGTISVVSCAPVALTAAQAGSATVSATAPPGTAGLEGVVQMTGTPAMSVLLLADQVIISGAAPSGQNWQSQLPHGQDDAVLADGYPLLELPVSLTTAAVAGQSQIDGYADGYLPAVTGTQATPLLVLGAGQGPAVKDITLGSYTQFAATSPLHPANPDGSPGLQTTGRIVGYTLYPPSQNQTEYSWLQLGQIEVIA